MSDQKTAEAIKKNNSSKSKLYSISTKSDYDLIEYPNYLFQTNQIPRKSVPRVYINEIHTNWFGNYHLLEYDHEYIQWLFPVFESAGMSLDSYILTEEEASMIRQDFSAAVNVIKSYKLMLNFYGMLLHNIQTGEVRINPKNWKSRYNNLNNSFHNFRRITRILMSLGQLGFSQYKLPWVNFFSDQFKKHSELQNCKQSWKQFWEPLCHPESPEYRRKTKERQPCSDSVLFTHIENQTEQWIKIRDELTTYGSVGHNIQPIDEHFN